MAERKPISKRTRFEIFKRDGFKCQYCGKSAPDVVLEIDHVIPVAHGGTNDVENLVTACRECNNGKGARELTEEALANIQKVQIDDIAERREQAEMMTEWRKALQEVVAGQLDAINSYLVSVTGDGLSENGKRNIRMLIRRFGFQEVYNSTEIAFEKYYHDNAKSWEYAFNKIGGICYNRKHRGWNNGN